jgi:DNA-binding beta-propeller fold protein YncE
VAVGRSEPKAWAGVPCVYPSEPRARTGIVRVYPSEPSVWVSGVRLYAGEPRAWASQVCLHPSEPSGCMGELGVSPGEPSAWASQVRPYPGEPRAWPRQVRPYLSEPNAWDGKEARPHEEAAPATARKSGSQLTTLSRARRWGSKGRRHQGWHPRSPRVPSPPSRTMNAPCALLVRSKLAATLLGALVGPLACTGDQFLLSTPSGVVDTGVEAGDDYDNSPIICTRCGGDTPGGDDGGDAMVDGGGGDATVESGEGGVVEGGDGEAAGDSSDGAVGCDDAGLTQCGSGTGGCVDLQFDSNNCGACGHGCQGVQCSAGLCQPSVVATIQSSRYVNDLTVDSTNVYFTTIGSSADAGPMSYAVMKCAKGGCGIGATTLASGLNFPKYIAVDPAGTNVYWTDYGGAVNTCSTAAFGVVPTTLATMPSGLSPEFIAVDSTRVYWDNFIVNGGTVVSCATVGCGGSPAVFATGQANPNRVAVDSTFVYWTNSISGVGTVVKCPLGGCAGNPPYAIASGQPGPSGVFVTSSDVYWMNTSTSFVSVVTCPLSGCGANAPTVLVSVTPSGIGDFVVDSTSLYWTDLNVGTVMKCPLAHCGGSATRLVSGPSRGLVVDSTSIYWISRTGIMKVAK